MNDDWRNWKNGKYDNRYHGVRRHSGQKNRKKIVAIIVLSIVGVGIIYFLGTYNGELPITITVPPQLSKVVNNTFGKTVTNIEKNPIIKNATSKLPTLPPQISKIVNSTLGVITTHMPSSINPIPQTPSKQELYQYALKIVNDDRKANGLNPVVLSSIGSAQNHADDQLRLQYFSHWNSDGVKPYVVYTKLGGRGSMGENDYYTYSYCPTSFCAENIFDPYQEIARGENEMMNNDASSNWGHRKDILDPNHTHVNFGIAYDHNRFYFVENFENNLVNWQTLKLVGNTLIMKGIMPTGYSLTQIDVFFDPAPKTLTEQDLDNSFPYNAGYYDQGNYVGMILPQLSGGYYYPECASGKITVTSSDGNSNCLDYETFENNSSNPNDIDISVDVSKWTSLVGLHTIYVELSTANGTQIQATSLTLEYLK